MPKCLLAPSILSFDLTELRRKVASMEHAGAQIVHLDVMDGRFVPPITFGDAYVKALRTATNALFEAHLMVENPEAQFESFIDAGCGRLIFHQETTAHSYRLVQAIKQRGVQVGVAINPGTPIDAVRDLLGVADLILVMTVNPGWGGQEFISSCLDKVAAIRALNPNIEIEVDGGIDTKTLPLARKAGANVFVVGSFLAKAPDLSDAVRSLNALCT